MCGLGTVSRARHTHEYDIGMESETGAVDHGGRPVVHILAQLDLPPKEHIRPVGIEVMVLPCEWRYLGLARQ